MKSKDSCVIVPMEDASLRAQRACAAFAVMVFLFPAVGFFAFHAVAPWIRAERVPGLLLVSMMPASLVVFFAGASVLCIREILRWRGCWKLDQDGIEYSRGSAKTRIRWNDVNAVWWGPHLAVFRDGNGEVRLPHMHASRSLTDARAFVEQRIRDQFVLPDGNGQPKRFGYRIVVVLLAVAACLGIAGMHPWALIVTVVAFVYVATHRTGAGRRSNWLPQKDPVGPLTTSL